MFSDALNVFPMISILLLLLTFTHIIDSEGLHGGTYCLFYHLWELNFSNFLASFSSERKSLAYRPIEKLAPFVSHQNLISIPIMKISMHVFVSRINLILEVLLTAEMAQNFWDFILLKATCLVTKNDCQGLECRN